MIIGHFVVLDLEGNTDFQQFTLHLLHYFLDLAWDLAIVMIRKLLAFGTDATEQTSACHSKVLTLQVSALGDDKELLLKAKS